MYIGFATVSTQHCSFIVFFPVLIPFPNVFVALWVFVRLPVTLAGWREEPSAKPFISLHHPWFLYFSLLFFAFVPFFSLYLCSLPSAKCFFFLDHSTPASLERVEHFGQQPSKKPSSFIEPPRKRGQNTGWGEASIQESIFSFKTYFLILNSYEHLLATSELKSGNKFVFTPTKIAFLSSSTYRAWREII